jgi:predicted AlkP superfamily phosphohydrolase/phosphomutase
MGRNDLVGDPGDELLRRAGWLATGSLAQGGQPLRQRAVSAAWQGARRLVPERARLALRRRVADRPWVEAMALADVDWSASKAFTVPPDSGSYIRLNVRGREPAGIVEPGTEYDALVHEIADAFRELTLDPGSEPAVERILLPDDIAGPEAPDGLPDLVVLWTRRRRVERVRSERFGAMDVPRTDVRSGQHRPLGYMVGVAPWLNGSGDGSFGQDRGSLVDLAPTVLTLLDVPVPEALQGSPLTQLVG